MREGSRRPSATSGGDAALVHRVALCAAALMGALAIWRVPLYQSNAATYMLQGIAKAGRGSLAEDWIAQTVDPFPLVSGLVYLTYRYLHPNLFYFYHLLLTGLYLLALASIVCSVFPGLRRGFRPAAVVALLGVLNSAWAAFFSRELTGSNWVGLLWKGVASQTLTEPIFQPSTFGILSLVSLAAFLRRRDRLAYCLAIATPYAHSSYLLTSLCLITGYSLLRWLQARSELVEPAWKKPLATWLIAGGLLVPLLVFQAIRFAPTDPETLREAHRILVENRIPHHALADRWLDYTVGLKALLFLAALFIVRTQPLALLLLGLAVPSVLLSTVQILSKNHSLALLFPWRISTVLLPVSSALILGWLMARLPSGRIASMVAIPLAAASCYFGYDGVSRTLDSIQRQELWLAGPTMRYVRENQRADHLYVTPPARLANFRLDTGARVFVDRKSHPYKDSEVVEWQRRVRAAERIQRSEGRRLCRQIRDLAANEGATHFFFEKSKKVSCRGLVRKHAGGRYSLYQIEARRSRLVASDS